MSNADANIAAAGARGLKIVFARFIIPSPVTTVGSGEKDPGPPSDVFRNPSIMIVLISRPPVTYYYNMMRIAVKVPAAPAAAVNY
jgi:hypothetical protein